MKKIKLLIPLAATVAATVPAFTVTSCGDPVDAKLITTGNSIVKYTYKLASRPTTGKITVSIQTKTGDAELSIFNKATGEATTNPIELDVAQDGSVVVPVGYKYAPAKSTLSNFNLTFTDTTSNQTSVSVNDLKFNYQLNFGDELVGGNYVPHKTTATTEHWEGKTFADEYTKDVIADPTIFQDDARYTTSKNISNTSGFVSMKAYFNDIDKMKDGDSGVHVHMNYQVKSDATTPYVVTQTTAGTTWKFTNFDINFSLETQKSYKFTDVDAGSKTSDHKPIRIVDDDNHYYLDGRLSGKFHCVISQSGQADVEVDVDTSANELDPINNYTDFTSQVSNEWKASVILASGILSLTYNYDFGATIPNLKILSPYAKNAA